MLGSRLHTTLIYLIKVIAVLLLILSFFPLQIFDWQGRLPNLTSGNYVAPEQYLLGLLLITLLSLLIWLISVRTDLSKWQNFKILDLKLEVICLILIPLEVFFINQFLYSGKPMLLDSVVQLFQAKIFASGNITVPRPENFAFFQLSNLLVRDGLLATQYPPGHAFLLALFSFFPALLMPVLAGGSAWFIYRSTVLLFDLRHARLVLLLLCISPFFLFLAASFKEHISALCFLAGFTYYILAWLNNSQKKDFFLAVVCLMIAYNIRPLNALIFDLIFAYPVLRKVYRESQWKLLVQGIFLGLIGLFPILLFNLKTTGSAFLSGYIYNWGSEHGLGFHINPWGRNFTFTDGLINQALNLTFLNNYAFESFVPVLLFPALVFLFAKQINSKALYLFLAFFVTPLCFVFYWHTDFNFGPRFLYENIIFFFPVLAYCILKLFEFEKFKLFYKSILAALFFTQLCIGLPQKAAYYDDLFPSLKLSISDKLEKEGIRKALVFVKSSWNERVISKLKQYHDSPKITENAYRFNGLCYLTDWLNSVISRQLELEQIRTELEKIAKNRPRTELRQLSDHQRYRLMPERKLSKICEQEISYDTLVPTPYLGFLLENEASLSGDVIVARDLKDWNESLQARYSHLPVYYYYDEDLLTEKQFKDLLFFDF